eukprot:3940964-Pyramimonas_sp.AAC.1
MSQASGTAARPILIGAGRNIRTRTDEGGKDEDEDEETEEGKADEEEEEMELRVRFGLAPHPGRTARFQTPPPALRD